MSSTPAEPAPEPASSSSSSARPADSLRPDPGRRWMLAAWVSVILIPIGVLLAIVLGDALATALGGDDAALDGSGADIGIMLGAGLPAVAVMLIAPIAAIVCGVRARRFGRPLAIIPIIIGAAAVIWTVLTNTLPLLISGAFAG